MASSNLSNFPRNLVLGRHNLGSDSLKVMLVSSVPSEANLDAWVSRADVTNEVTGSGYTAGGIAQAYTLDALDTTNNRQPVTLTDITNGWGPTATFSAAGAIIYKNSGSAATDYLMFFVDFGGNVSCSAGTYSITYSSKFYANR